METDFLVYYDTIYVGNRLYSLVGFAAAYGLVKYVKAKLNKGLPLTCRNRGARAELPGRAYFWDRRLLQVP